MVWIQVFLYCPQCFFLTTAHRSVVLFPSQISEGIATDEGADYISFEAQHWAHAHGIAVSQSSPSVLGCWPAKTALCGHRSCHLGKSSTFQDGSLLHSSLYCLMLLFHHQHPWISKSSKCNEILLATKSLNLQQEFCFLSSLPWVLQV